MTLIQSRCVLKFENVSRLLHKPLRRPAKDTAEHEHEDGVCVVLETGSKGDLLDSICYTI